MDELGNIIHMGVTIYDKHFYIVVDCFVCDAPARAFIKNIKYHSGYFGCDKCIDEVDYVDGKMTIQSVNAQLRTDGRFEEMENKEHHRGILLLASLPIGLVSQFVSSFFSVSHDAF